MRLQQHWNLSAVLRCKLGCAAQQLPIYRCVFVLLLQEQTDIAWFWSLAGNTSSISGFWFDVGREVSGCCWLGDSAHNIRTDNCGSDSCHMTGLVWGKLILHCVKFGVLL
jgi:hypothetical protein